MAAAFMAYFVTVLLMRMRAEILERERHTAWVTETVGKET
jgi:heme exporter protein C